jgi:hypothetical protein
VYLVALALELKFAKAPTLPPMKLNATLMRESPGITPMMLGAVGATALELTVVVVVDATVVVVVAVDVVTVVLVLVPVAMVPVPDEVKVSVKGVSAFTQKPWLTGIVVRKL